MTASRAAGGTDWRLPVERLSTTTTSWPAEMQRSTTCEPMNPAPPVTRTLMVIALDSARLGWTRQEAERMLRPWARPGSPRAPPPYLRYRWDQDALLQLSGYDGPARRLLLEQPDRRAATSTSIPRPSRRTRPSTSSTTRFERGAIEIGAAAVRQRARARGLDDGRRRLHRDDDVHGAAVPEPRRPADQRRSR